MGSYRVLFPVGFSDSKGNAMSCTTVGTVVDVDDEQAAQLVADGKLEAVEADPEPEVPVDGGVGTLDLSEVNPDDAAASRRRSSKAKAE